MAKLTTWVVVLVKAPKVPSPVSHAKRPAGLGPAEKVDEDASMVVATVVGSSGTSSAGQVAEETPGAVKFALTPFCTSALEPVRVPPGTNTTSSEPRFAPAGAGSPSEEFTVLLPRPNGPQPDAVPTAKVSFSMRALPAGRVVKLGFVPGSAGHVPASSLYP